MKDTLSYTSFDSKEYSAKKEQCSSGIWKMHVATGRIAISEKARKIIGVSKEAANDLLQKPETGNTFLNDDVVIRKLQQEVDESAAELEKQNLRLVESRQSLERKDNFIRIASHELKTPITAMQGYIQLLVRSYSGKCG